MPTLRFLKGSLLAVLLLLLISTIINPGIVWFEDGCFLCYPALLCASGFLVLSFLAYYGYAVDQRRLVAAVKVQGLKLDKKVLRENPSYLAKRFSALGHPSELDIDILKTDMGAEAFRCLGFEVVSLYFCYDIAFGARTGAAMILLPISPV